MSKRFNLIEAESKQYLDGTWSFYKKIEDTKTGYTFDVKLNDTFHDTKMFSINVYLCEGKHFPMPSTDSYEYEEMVCASKETLIFALTKKNEEMN